LRRMEVGIDLVIRSLVLGLIAFEEFANGAVLRGAGFDFYYVDHARLSI